MQTSEDMISGDEKQKYDDGVVSHSHNFFEASESNRELSDGFVESARNSCNPDGEMLEPSSQFSQGNDLSMFWSKDETGTSESRSEPSNGLLESSWNSSYPHCEMLEPSSSQISHEDGFSYFHTDSLLHHSSSYYKNDSERAPFETHNRELFNYGRADLVMHNQQSSDVEVANLAPFETPNYSETSSFNGFSNVHHKQESLDYYHQNGHRGPFGMEYNLMPDSENGFEKPSNIFSNEYRRIPSNIKVEKNIVLSPSTVIASRPSEVVDSARDERQGIEWSLSKSFPSISSKNRGIYPKAETEDGLFQSSRSHPSPVKSSAVAAHSHISKVSYQGVESKTSDQSNADDDSDLCVLEDMSAPARPSHVAKQVMTSRDQIVTTHSRRKPNDERVIFRVALQVFSNCPMLSLLACMNSDIPLTCFWCT